MATWHIGTAWTPNLAVELADVLTRAGAGHLRSVLKLRDAAGAKSTILGQRAEAAYEEAMTELRDEEDWPAIRRQVSGVLSRAIGQQQTDGGDDEQADWIQGRVIARVLELGLSSYEIAKRTDGRVSEDHVRDYLTRRKSMGSHKLQHVLAVLGLELRAASTHS